MRAPVVAGCSVLERPFTTRGEVDHEECVQVVDHLVTAGARSNMFPGCTGEFPRLRDDERAALTAPLLRRAAGVPGVVAVISVPDHSTHQAVARSGGGGRHGLARDERPPPTPVGAVRGRRARAHPDGRHPVASTVVIVQYALARTGTAIDAPTPARSTAQTKGELAPFGARISTLLERIPELSWVVGDSEVRLIDALWRGAADAQPGCSFGELSPRMGELWDGGRPDATVVRPDRMLPHLSYWTPSVELGIAAEKPISRRRGPIDSARCRELAHALTRRKRL